MSRTSPEQHRGSVNRSHKRRHGIAQREPEPPVQLYSVRQALKLLTQSVNRVRADATLSTLDVSRFEALAAKTALLGLSTQFDARLDALAAHVKRLQDSQRSATSEVGVKKLPLAPVALPASTAQDGEYIDGAFVEDGEYIAPPKRKPGRPRKHTPNPVVLEPDGAPAPRNRGGRPRKDGNPPGWRPPLPNVPTSEEFADALERFVKADDSADSPADDE